MDKILRSQIKKLRSYVRHRGTCNLYLGADDCNCGLTKLLMEIQEKGANKNDHKQKR